jgi:hypothetical protein
MAASYKSVNFALRPAKAVERKMLCEVFRRLARFAPLDTYRYIGFGSFFYSDFLLFHRSLGVKHMINIEKEVRDKTRFRFNRPFGCIKCIFEKSREALPKLSWTRRSIVWLDYLGQCNEDVLADIDTVCSNARSGSMLVVTLNAQFTADPQDSETARKKIDELRRMFTTKLPTEVTFKGHQREVDASAIAEGALGRVYARIVLDAMTETCRLRSAALDEERKVAFRQLFDFEYRDGAQMITVGGLLYERRDQARANACGFDGLDFVVESGRPPHELRVPSLTHREARYLDRHMPVTKAGSYRRTGLSMDMVREYERIYRWFPAFAETEL